MSTLTNRTLFFGDNLKILQERIPNDTFDLIYLDPPFNSDRNYNVLFKEGQVDSSAQIHAFEDTWEWTPETIRVFEGLKTHPNPNIAILINSLAQFIGHNPMMAYLVMMAARFIELHRVLKPTGSMYLHCDPTASHYLKVIMDVIFGKENFKNEIVWSYKRYTAMSNRFQRLHDIILFYGKSETVTFNDLREEYGLKSGKADSHYKQDEEGKWYRWQKRRNQEPYKIYLSEGRRLGDVWEIPIINASAKERLGYPTQKPETLLERIIKASSNEKSWILDPFCGCGTSVAVAERLNRKWVGIDISMLSINVIYKRLREHYPGYFKINIDGIPMDYESAAKLAEKDKYTFQDWAISLIGASPPSGESRKGADRGIDGLILFYEKIKFSRKAPTLRKIIVQVKGGTTGRGDVAKLKGDMERETAPMGILITLHEPTQEMKRESALAGEYKYSETKSFPRIQILSVRDWFAERTVNLPSDTINPFKKATLKLQQGVLF